jgi:hypothetical protein
LGNEWYHQGKKGYTNSIKCHSLLVCRQQKI